MTIQQDVKTILSYHGRKVNPRIQTTYYDKKKYAIGTISNQERPPGNWTQANSRRVDRAILEAAISISADLRDQGIRFDLHHMVPQSKGGSYHISNIRLIPSCINRLIGDNEYTDEVIEDLTKMISQTPIGADQKIPDWFKCCPLGDFIRIAASHLKK